MRKAMGIEQRIWWGIFIFLTCICFSAPAVAGSPAIQQGEGSETTQPKPQATVQDEMQPDLAAASLQSLEEAMDQVFQKLEAIAADPGTGTDVKKARAMEYIKNYRHGPDNRRRFQILNVQGTMLMDPIQEFLMGKDVTGIRDQTGKLFYLEFVTVSVEKGGGYVTYLWPQPGQAKPAPTTALVRLYEPWEWVIGTGAHQDTIEAFSTDEEIEPYVPLTPIPDDRTSASSV